MGYTTDFVGRFNFSRELTRKEEHILREFTEERHGGNTQVFEEFPGFYCQWVPTDDGLGLEWDDGEKFYEYDNWLRFLIEKFFKPWGIVVNGEVEWHGEERSDVGCLVCKDNVVEKKRGRIVYD